MQLLEKLCAIHGTSGDEGDIHQFLYRHIIEHAVLYGSPQVVSDGLLQDGLIVVKGMPSTAIFCHIDTIGFMTRYDNKLTLIGSPECTNGAALVGKWNQKNINARLVADAEGEILCLDCTEQLPPGIRFAFEPFFRSNEVFVQSPYLDNRLGVFMALEILKRTKNVLLAFTTYEEHGGGNVPVMLQYMQQRWQITTALVLDITWVTEGVHHGKGTVISLRDKNIPRQAFVNRLITIAMNHNIPFQLEVEEEGSSDGREIQLSPYPMDWCFVGPPESGVHSPDEKVYWHDIHATIDFYCKAIVQLHV